MASITQATLVVELPETQSKSHQASSNSTARMLPEGFLDRADAKLGLGGALSAVSSLSELTIGQLSNDDARRELFTKTSTAQFWSVYYEYIDSGARLNLLVEYGESEHIQEQNDRHEDKYDRLRDMPVSPRDVSRLSHALPWAIASLICLALVLCGLQVLISPIDDPRFLETSMLVMLLAGLILASIGLWRLTSAPKDTSDGRFLRLTSRWGLLGSLALLAAGFAMEAAGMLPMKALPVYYGTCMLLVAATVWTATFHAASILGHSNVGSAKVGQVRALAWCWPVGLIAFGTTSGLFSGHAEHIVPALLLCIVLWSLWLAAVLHEDLHREKVESSAGEIARQQLSKLAWLRRPFPVGMLLMLFVLLTAGCAYMAIELPDRPLGGWIMERRMYEPTPEQYLEQLRSLKEAGFSGLDQMYQNAEALHAKHKRHAMYYAGGAALSGLVAMGLVVLLVRALRSPSS